MSPPRTVCKRRSRHLNWRKEICPKARCKLTRRRFRNCASGARCRRCFLKTIERRSAASKRARSPDRVSPPPKPESFTNCSQSGNDYQPFRPYSRARMFRRDGPMCSNHLVLPLGGKGARAAQERLCRELGLQNLPPGCLVHVLPKRTFPLGGELKIKSLKIPVVKAATARVKHTSRRTAARQLSSISQLSMPNRS